MLLLFNLALALEVSRSRKFVTFQSKSKIEEQESTMGRVLVYNPG